MTVTLARTRFNESKKNVSRQTLERNVLDYLTCGDDIDFLTAQEIVEEATREELIVLLIMIQNEDDDNENAINEFVKEIAQRI